MRIALFEDHRRLAESIVDGLERFGLGVDSFESGQDGISATKDIRYDGVVLDLGLPDIDGIEVLRELRLRDSSIPVLILSARDGIDDRVVGLDAGADDYLLKPFEMKELAARLRALLRRPGRSLGSVLEVGNLRIDVSSRQASVEGLTVRFSSREIATLELLMRREGQVISKSALEDGLYGLSTDVNPNTIEVLISRLRRRLEAINAGCSIHTLYGIGYLLKE